MVMICSSYSRLDVVDDDENVFWFEVSVDDATATVHVVEAEENLFSNLTDEEHRNAFVLMSPDQRQQILAENLKNHADMHSVRPPMPEVVQKRDHVRPTPVRARHRRTRHDQSL